MRALREAVQALLAVSLTAGVLYFTATGILDPAIVVGLASAATGYYFAERKNGEERQHVEKMAAYQVYHERTEP